MIIGIDFSINYPAMVINDNDELKFISFIREDEYNSFTKKQHHITEELLKSNFYSIIFLPEKLKLNKTEEYTYKEKMKSIDANNVTNIILSEIKKYSEDCIVNIEGFSFNSIGNSNNELIGYQYILRNKLLNSNIKFNIYSPTQIKKSAGKGNLNKSGMMTAFLTNISNDSKIENNEIYKIIVNNIEEIRNKNEKILKPIEDLIDSYWVMRHYELNN